MAASGRIKGITIELNGDSTGLTKALSSVDNALKNTQNNLRDINKALKLDPGNVDLLKDKQSELSREIEKTKEKLEMERKAMEQMKNAPGFDENSQKAKNLQTQIDLDTAALKELEKESKEFGSVFKQQMVAAGEKMKELGTKIEAVGTKIRSIGTGLTAAVTLPLVAAGTAAVSKFAEVDKTMQLVNSTMGNTEKQAKLISDAMKEAAANSTFGMNDAATATLNLARAGLTAEQAAATLAPAMNLAAGEGGELDTVSAGLVATINGFKGSFDEAAQYADVFANACNNSALDVNSLSQAMSIAAPIFSSAGYSVKDAALYMGVMANAGIDANTAANSLKTGLAKLVSPAKEGQEWINRLGISITNADGSMKDSVSVQKQLHQAFSTLSESEQIAAASAIFGKNQMANWLALISTAPADVAQLSEALGVEGTTAKMASDMMSGFGGSIEKLKSSIDVAATSLGEALAPTISKIADGIQKAVDWFNSLSDAQRQFIAKVGLVIAAIGPLLVIIGTLISSVGQIIKVVGAILPLLSGAGGITAIVTKLGTVLTATVIPAIASVGPQLLAIIAIIAAVVAAIVLLVKNWDNISKAFKEGAKAAANAVKSAWSSLESATQHLGENIANKWNEIKTNVGTAVTNMKNGAVEGFNNLRANAIASVENVKTGLQAKWNEIRNATSSAVNNMRSSAISAFQSMGSSIASAIGNMKANIVNGFQSAVSYIKGLPGQAISWGRDIVAAVIDGIKSKIEQMKAAMKDLAKTIKSFIGFSEPEVGPLSDFHTYMPDMIDLMTKGIENGIPKIEEALGTLTGSMRASMTPDQMAAAGSTTNTVSINVYGAQGQNVNELADVIERRITENVVRRGVAFA